MKIMLLSILMTSLESFSQAEDALNSIYQNTDTTTKILVISTFNPQSTNYRKNKKELFERLADSLRSLLSEKVKTENLGAPIIIKELIQPIFDSKASLDSLFNLYNARSAIVIKQLNAFFEQTKVEVSRDDDGTKSREASYDICSEVNYVLYNKNDKPYHSQLKSCNPFTTRNVISGLLAGGPDIVGKTKHAYKIIAKNAEEYIREINTRLKADY